jgi:hypothetical protein
MTVNEDLRRLLDHCVAGVLLIEEVLDAEQPGWLQAPGKRSYVPHPLRNAWGALGSAWINVASNLVDRGEPSWAITPLVTRTIQGGQHQWELAPDGHLEITPDAVSSFDWRESLTGDLVRIVDRPAEPRYTLDEARRILEVCSEHEWEVVTEGARPVGVRCKNCGETRPVGSST